MKIFKVSYKTIYNWLNRWELEGMVGLYNKPGRGYKPKFNPQQKAKIREWAQLFSTVNKPTVIVVDQSSIHKARYYF